MQVTNRRHIAGWAALATCALLPGCADLPRDPEYTTNRVSAEGIVQLGVVAGAAPDARAEHQIANVAAQLGASIVRRTGDGEGLLRRLEDGDLDLVYGVFAADSPWHTHVHLGDVPGRAAQPAKHVAAPRFAYRNGENGWIMRVEGAGR